MALRRFMSIRGTPTRFQSDRGEQLVAAAKQVATWDFKEVVKWAGRKGIEWTLVPTGGQHFNGQAERMIGLIKQQLWRTFEGKRLTHEETLMVLAEAVQRINSRSLTRSPRAEGEPLCVQDLMLGRAKPGQVEVKLESGNKLTKRFENVQRIQQEFWKRWIEEVFPEKLRQSKWKRERRDLKVGDIVLRKDETAAGQTYKYAKVVKVHASADGKVRAADVEYKLPGESVFRTTTRPIHKLVLVVPVEEQGLEIDKIKEPEAPSREVAAKAAAVAPQEEVRQARGQAELEGDGGKDHAEAEAELEAELPPEVVGEPRTAGSSPKGKRAVIVTTPKEEAKVVDQIAGPKKRGRPRKSPAVDPLDPHKGSVLYPERGVCADPVDKGAILGEGGAKNPSSDKGRQLATDLAGEKT